MQNLTLEDVAKQAGVSRATVSRVVNNQAGVKENVRESVLKVIKETGYSPHAAARTLASHRTNAIGLFLPHSTNVLFTDPYFPVLIKGVAQACNTHEYTLAFYLVDSKKSEETIFPRVCRKGTLDGMVVQSSHHGDQWFIGHLVDSGMPFIVLGRPYRFDNLTYIDIDNVHAAYQAVSHLARLGRKRIATITGPIASTAGIDRVEGYRKALVDRNLVLDERLIADGDFTESGGYYAMGKLLAEKPDAVFAASDVTAIGAMRAIFEAGLKIPGDIAIVGFDDLPIANFSGLQLTTVRQPVFEFGFQAIEALIDQIVNNNNAPHRIILDTELIIRDTCGATKK